MRANDPTASPEIPLLAAPHRTLFFAGLVSLLAASTWWGLHLLARSTGTPVFCSASRAYSRKTRATLPCLPATTLARKRTVTDQSLKSCQP